MKEILKTHKQLDKTNRYFFKDVFNRGYMCEPINGCSVGCYYCNTFRGAKRRGIVRTRKEWLIPKIDNIDIKVFENELHSAMNDDSAEVDFISLCGITDPFCNKETTKTHNLCKSIIDDHRVITRTLTKSKIPESYFDFNPTYSEIGITIDGLKLYNKHSDIANIATLEKLKNKGFYVFIALHPLNLYLPLFMLQIILQRLTFVNQIKFGILDKYEPDSNEKQFEKAYKYSDYIYNFCESNKITFMNGGYWFSRMNRERLLKINIYNKPNFK